MCTIVCRDHGVADIFVTTKATTRRGAGERDWALQSLATRAIN